MGKRRGCSYCEGKEIKGLLKGREEGSYFGEKDWDASKRKLNVISLLCELNAVYYVERTYGSDRFRVLRVRTVVIFL